MGWINRNMVNMDRMNKIAGIHSTSRWVVEFDNPAAGPIVRGFSSWATAMTYAASRRRKYGRFDGYEKPRIRRGLA